MLAYHNDPKLKKQILQQLQGSNLNLPVEKFENNLGIPMVLAHLEDAIFWGLSNVKTKQWPIRFFSSIQVGADLSGVWRDFALWLLIDPADGVIQYTTPGTEVYHAIMQVAQLYQDGYTEQQMLDAADAAYDAVTKADDAYAAAASTASAAAHAAVSTAYAYAAAASTASAAAHAAVSTAYNVAAAAATAYPAYNAYNAAHATRDAAYAAARVDAKFATHVAWDVTDAYNAAYMKISNKLIELLQQRMPNVSLPQ